MNQDTSDRIPNHSLHRQKPIKRCSHENCDLFYRRDSNTNIDDTKPSFSSQRRRSTEQLKPPRSIDPEMVIASHGKKSFEEEHYPGSRMIVNWRNNFLDRGNRLQGNELDVAEAAQKGLMEVGQTECFKTKDLARIWKEFNMVKVKSRDKIVMYCIRLYTRDVFVNRVINQALRDDDDESKSETLGPFCYLLTLYNYASDIPVYNGNVFRGCQLEPSVIDTYRQMIGKSHVKWLGFTSTSKSDIIAKGFGCNVLFNIDLSRFNNRFKYGRPIDISNLSEMIRI